MKCCPAQDWNCPRYLLMSSIIKPHNFPWEALSVSDCQPFWWALRGNLSRPSKALMNALHLNQEQLKNIRCDLFLVSCNCRSSYRLIWGWERRDWVEGRESRWRPTRIPQSTGSGKKCADLSRLQTVRLIWVEPSLPDWLPDARFSPKAARAEARLRSDVAATFPSTFHIHLSNKFQWWKINQSMVTCDSWVTMGKKVSSLPPIWSHSVPLVIRSPSKQELQSRAAVKEALRGT